RYAKPLFCCSIVLVAACAAPQGDETLRPHADTITGSNIPRRDSAPRRETTILIDDAIRDLIKSNGPRGAPGG
ncbi:MAG TPA: hypothetical protein VMW56_06345, partial [Candidatus Margulisiibacteriota bacterium]|nr:hypothetical protein [Candidatus Margulisiibacteriota bacterium]